MDCGLVLQVQLTANPSPLPATKALSITGDLQDTTAGANTCSVSGTAANVALYATLVLVEVVLTQGDVLVLTQGDAGSSV